LKERIPVLSSRAAVRDAEYSQFSQEKAQNKEAEFPYSPSNQSNYEKKPAGVFGKDEQFTLG
jgi:hypothetical protein